MSWLKQGDEIDRDRRYKRFRRGTQRLIAVGVFTTIGTWSAGELTDGLVPFDIPGDYGITPAMVQRMLDAGLWHVDTGSCPDCKHTEPPPRDHFVICQWWHHLEDRETVLRRRKLDADRKKLKRQREQERAEADLLAAMSAPDTAPDSALESSTDAAWESGVPARPGPARPVVGGTGGGPPHPIGEAASSTPPRYRCASHAQLPADVEGPNCIGCRNARLTAEAAAKGAREAARQAQIDADRDAAAEQRRQLRERQELIVACNACNHDGLKPGPEVRGRQVLARCDHPGVAS